MDVFSKGKDCFCQFGQRKLGFASSASRVSSLLMLDFFKNSWTLLLVDHSFEYEFPD